MPSSTWGVRRDPIGPAVPGGAVEALAVERLAEGELATVVGIFEQ